MSAMKLTRVTFTGIALALVLLVYIAGCDSLVRHSSFVEIRLWASICCLFCIVSGLCAIRNFATDNDQMPRSDDPVEAVAVIAGALAVLCLLLVGAQILRDDCARAVAPQAFNSMNISSFYFFQLALLVTYAGCVLCLPKGVWATHAKLSEDKELGAAVGKMKGDLQREELAKLEDMMSKISAASPATDKFAVIRDKVFRAIDYAIKRHDWYEDQRSRIFQIILGISTLALTIAGFFSKNLPHFLPVYASVGGLFSVILIALTAAVLHYNKELDADRPYRSISDVRFWFFRYNLPAHSSAGGDINDDRLKAEAVVEERRRFLKRVSENFEPAVSLREDLEQLFILQVLQRYKNESLTRLRWLLSYTLLILPPQFSLYFWAMWMAGSIWPPVPS